jgi:dTMP kinase
MVYSLYVRLFLNPFKGAKYVIKLEFEGTDGAGKTTGLKYFIDKAKERGISVVETREVGNPHIEACVKLREFVLNPENKLRGETMELIFSAMRYENDIWFRNLTSMDNPPDLVVSDRGWFSHLAYTDHNVSTEFTKLLYRDFMAKTTKKPDVIIYFSVDSKTALERRVRRGQSVDVIESKGIEFQEKVRHSFDKHLWLAVNDGMKVFHVNANENLPDVYRQLDHILGKVSTLVDSMRAVEHGIYT